MHTFQHIQERIDEIVYVRAIIQRAHPVSIDWVGEQVVHCEEPPELVPYYHHSDDESTLPL